MLLKNKHEKYTVNGLPILFLYITFSEKFFMGNASDWVQIMERENAGNGTMAEALSGLSADRLRGRQSVRATFRLPSEVIDLLSMAASQLGLKQKSLFDQLVEDREVLAQLAQVADRYQPRGEQRQQKTYVLSRDALLALEFVAKSTGLPRDLLVELCIQRLVPVLDSEQEKQQKRADLLGDLTVLCQQTEALYLQSAERLGEDDPATRLLQSFCMQGQRYFNELRQIIG